MVCWRLSVTGAEIVLFRVRSSPEQLDAPAHHLLEQDRKSPPHKLQLQLPHLMFCCARHALPAAFHSRRACKELILTRICVCSSSLFFYVCLDHCVCVFVSLCVHVSVFASAAPASLIATVIVSCLCLCQSLSLSIYIYICVCVCLSLSLLRRSGLQLLRGRFVQVFGGSLRVELGEELGVLGTKRPAHR